MDLRIPQTRDYRDENGQPFSPRSLERGVRSERTMTLAAAEMEVQGVSTQKVTAIMPYSLLTAIGIGPDGKRSILGCSVQLSEAEMHW